MKITRLFLSVILVTFIAGCTSVGNLGMVTRSTSDPGALLKENRSYKELGRAEGQACRFFILAIIPGSRHYRVTTLYSGLHSLFRQPILYRRYQLGRRKDRLSNHSLQRTDLRMPEGCHHVTRKTDIQKRPGLCSEMVITPRRLDLQG